MNAAKNKYFIVNIKMSAFKLMNWTRVFQKAYV